MIEKLLYTRRHNSEQSALNLSNSQLDILHCLRGFCAFYVVVFHAKYILWSGGREYLQVFPRIEWSVLEYLAFLLDMLSSAGFEMVIFFFVLSGFFIRYQQQRNPRSPFSFYKNRIERIYPPFFSACLLAIAGLLIVGTLVPLILSDTGRELNMKLALAWQNLHSFDGQSLFNILTFQREKGIYIGYNDVYWSLLPEAIFYLLVPIVFREIRLYYVLSVLIYVASFLLAPLELTSLSVVGPFIGYAFTYNIYFALGCFFYDTVTESNWLSIFRRLPGFAVATIVLLQFVALIGLALLHAPISGLLASLLAITSMSALMAGYVDPTAMPVRAFHQVGLYSFSLYLYHFPLLILCYAGLVWLTGETVFYTRYYWCILPLVVAICYSLYQVTEKQFIRYFRQRRQIKVS